MTASFPPPPPPAYAETADGAQKALVFGLLALLCCGCFTGVPAIFFGAQALSEIEASHGRLVGRGMAWAGIILGIVGTIAAGTGAVVYQQHR